MAERYEREIDELLRRLEREQRASLPFRRRSGWARARRRLIEALTGPAAIERLMGLAAVFFLGTCLLALVVPRFAVSTAVLALACFVLALALSLAGGLAGRRPPWEYRPYRRGDAVAWDRLVARVRQWLRRLAR